MFGSLGLPELLLIFVIALLLFGPRKLPEIGKTLGKALNEFKRASNDLQRSLEEEIAADDLKQVERDAENALRATPDAKPGPAAGAPGQAAGPGTEAAAPAPPSDSHPVEPK